MRTPLTSCLFLSIAIFMIAACSDSQKEGKLLKDTKKSEEIMSFISSDSLMTEEMINHIVLNKKANQQFRNVMKSMMTKDFLIELMKDDSILTNDVMCSVMEMAGKYASVCQQMKQTIERYDLKEKLGLDLMDKTIIEKDHLQVQKYLKIPPQKTN